MSDHLALVQACPPTAVEHCVEAHLTNAGESNLVVARGTMLEVYTLRERCYQRQHEPTCDNPVGTGGGPASQGSRAELDGITAAYLGLVTRVRLNGTVEALGVIPQQPRDLLMLAFADAKISILEFDLISQSLHTRSVHSFEAVSESIGCRHIPRPLLAVTQNCAALLGFGAVLFVLPFRPDGSIAGSTGDALLVPPLISELEPAQPDLPLAAAAAASLVEHRGGGNAPDTSGWWRESLHSHALHHVSSAPVRGCSIGVRAVSLVAQPSRLSRLAGARHRLPSQCNRAATMRSA